jgi:serine-type D-Ala-D-Ala carboxypeptidase (penicillin-binding protein 5/6)
MPAESVLADDPSKPMPQLVPVSAVPVLNTSSELETSQFIATISAHSALVLDIPSAAILVEKNSHEAVSPASTTKMLTALVARDQYQLDEVVTIKEAAFSVGHIVGFEIGEQLKVEDLLTSLLVSSGNDAAFALAAHHPQGYSGFIAAMNKKATALHLSHSSFRNPSGLDDLEHLSTARDLSIVARELMKDSLLAALVGTKQTVIHDVSGSKQHALYNTNELLHVEPGVVGIKTGTTELAKESLVTEVDRNGRQLLIVVLGSEDRYRDTRLLLRWVEQHYEWVEPEESRLQLEKVE